MTNGKHGSQSSNNRPKSDHPDPGGNWPAKTGNKSGGKRGNAVPPKGGK